MGWSDLPRVERQRLLVVFHEVVVQPLHILGLHVRHTVPTKVQESSGQLVNFIPSWYGTRIQDLLTLIKNRSNIICIHVLTLKGQQGDVY